MAERALVTGVAGFIGSHLAEALLARDWTVVGVDCLTDTYAPEIKEANLRGLNAHPRFTFHRQDLLDADLAVLCSDVAVIFHHAAQAGVRSSWGGEFATYTRNNIDATQRLLEHVRRHPVRRFVYASSSSVYGQTERLPMREDGPTAPHSPYGVSKLAAEHLAKLYHANFGIPTVSLRYFTVYGPRQRPDMAFHRFMAAALAGRPLTVFGDGAQTRDFTFVSDAVAATLGAAERGAGGAVYNVGGGTRAVLRDAIGLIATMAGGVAVEHSEGQYGDVRHTYADTTRAREALGWEPSVGLEEGLARQLEWHRAGRGSAIDAS